MKLINVLAAVVALFVCMTVLMYVVSPSTFSVPSRAGAQDNGAPPKNDPVEGKYKYNPFEIVEQAPFPRADLESKEYNFGQMPVGESEHHTFTIKNIGEAPLKLARGESTCKCTVGKLGDGDVPQQEVPPGGSANVEMEWHPPTQSMEFTQSATIWTNDPQLSEIRLTVVGQVVPDVIRYPEESWTVTVNEHMPSQFHGMIIAMLQDSFEITGIETSQPWITVTPRPLTPEEARKEMGRCGYELNCEIQPEMPVGLFQETIKIKTNIEKHETFEFTISGTRTGPFNIVGPGWISQLQRLKAGRVSSAEGKQMKLSIFAQERDPPLEIAVESVDPPVLKTSVERTVLDAAAQRLQFTLTLEVPKGATPARYSDDHPIVLQLKTNHPDAPVLTLSVDIQID